MKRFTLLDFAADKQNLIAWLNQDGNPPLVQVAIKDASAASSSRYGYRPSYREETRAVTDEDTLSIWWNNHRNALALEWSKSALNTAKPQTHTQFIAWCLKEVGIKGFGTVAQRVQRAAQFRPDLFKDAASVKAEEAAEELRVKALRAQMNLAASEKTTAA